MISTRYYQVLVQLAGNRAVVWALFGIFYAMLFLPIVISVGKPLMMRRKQMIPRRHELDVRLCDWC